MTQDFVWGTSTAAYQIEGAYDKDGKGPNIWDIFSHIDGNVLNNENGDVACDHYHRFEEDLDLIKDLVDNYRFSFSWSRIIPEGTGAVNQQGIDFYNRLIDGMIKRGITPWATMFHWDLPQALQDKGGFANRECTEWMREYAGVLEENFGDRIKNWMILNEPSVYSYMGHARGFHAPGIADKDTYFKVVHNEMRIIGTVYDFMKQRSAEYNVGSTFTAMPIRAQDPLFLGQYPKIFKDEFAPLIQEDDAALIKTELDFVGVQHYSPIYTAQGENGFLGADFGKVPEHIDTTDIGWPIEPDAFYETLMHIKNKYNAKNIIITENGIALFDKKTNGEVDDTKRINYLNAYIEQMDKAIKDGAPISGYFVWSLLDNLEWSEGYDMRFGLVHIDFENDLMRTPKASYDWFKHFVKKRKPRKQAA